MTELRTQLFFLPPDTDTNTELWIRAGSFLTVSLRCPVLGFWNSDPSRADESSETDPTLDQPGLICSTLR